MKSYWKMNISEEKIREIKLSWNFRKSCQIRRFWNFDWIKPYKIKVFKKTRMNLHDFCLTPSGAVVVSEILNFDREYLAQGPKSYFLSFFLYYSTLNSVLLATTLLRNDDTCSDWVRWRLWMEGACHNCLHLCRLRRRCGTLLAFMSFLLGHNWKIWWCWVCFGTTSPFGVFSGHAVYLGCWLKF